MAKDAKYVVNERGEKVSVVLGIAEYEKMLQELEELESIRAYDAAKASGETPVPFQQAIADIERERK